MNGEVKEDEIGSLSHEACHEHLARLRVLLSEATARLDGQAEAYYFLCETAKCTPDSVLKGVEALIEQTAVGYLESWKELIAVAGRADRILEQMAATAAVELELQKLEADADA